jgi:hypothetical protein
MRRCIFFVLVAILLNTPVVPVAAQDTTPDSGRTSLFNYPVFNMPIGMKPDYKNDKKEGEETSEQKKAKEKEMMDKKVDDAINKAWGNK